jgi:tetratricopeptide (TPR) repeat protein
MDNATHDMHERLVNYIDGISDEPEKKEVEHNLANDPEWQQALQDLLVTREAIKLHGLQQQVADIHKEMMEENTAPVIKMDSKRTTLRAFFSVAAALLVIVGGYLIYQFYTLSPDKILSSYYRPFELPAVRGEGGAYTDFAKSYIEKDFKKTTVLFSKMDSADVKDRFLAANAWFRLNNFDKAIQQFNKIIETEDRTHSGLFRDETEYYLAMAYIANKDYDLALPLLRKIRDDDQHTYHKEVDAKLIRKVKLLKWR